MYSRYSDAKLLDVERFNSCFAQQLATVVQNRKNALLDRIVKFGVIPAETENIRGQLAELFALEKAFEKLQVKPLDIAIDSHLSTNNQYID
jgi:hypothetical protein